MPTFLVTVRERVDYVLRVEASDHARAADAAVEIVALEGWPCAECTGRTITDRRAVETEEV